MLLGWCKYGAAVSASYAASCAVRNLQQDAFLLSVWFDPQLQVIAWPLMLFVQWKGVQKICIGGQGAQSVLDSYLATDTYLDSGSLHQRLFGKGPGSVMINSRNLQLVVPLSSYPLPYRLVPAWKAVTCVSYVCQSENVLGFLFFKEEWRKK